MPYVTLCPLSDDEMEWLDQRLLDHGNDDSVLDLSELDGFFTAIASGPTLVPMSQWWSALWGGSEPEWTSKAERERVVELLVRHLATLSHTLSDLRDKFVPLLLISRDEHGKEQPIVEEWCYGYMRGVELAQWPPMPLTIQESLDAVALHGSAERLDALEALTEAEFRRSLAAIVPAVLQIYDWWAPSRAVDLPPQPIRVAAKVGRNDLCPCGSGKKYKHCCLR